jgi:hypothetical protein
MGYYGEGVGLVMDGGWFEENNGTSINIGSRPSNSVGSTFTRCVLHNVQIENALTGTTQGIYITSTNTSIPQYLDLYSCTIYGHTTDVTTDEGAITTNSNSKIGVHSETNGGTYATSVTTATGIPFSSVTSTPTTVAGYGITNAVTAWGDYIPSAQALSIGITGNLYIGGTSLFASNVQINAPLTISQFSQSKSGGSSLVGEATLVSGIYNR